MKISLIFPCWTHVFESLSEVANSASTFPPLNLAYLAAIAEENGHTVQLIDGEAEHLTVAEVTARVKEFSPDLIGMTATTPLFHNVVAQAEALKAALSVPIIVGGPHVTYFKEKVFRDLFDYFVIGQCEGTFASFLEAFASKQDISRIPGILYRKNGGILFTGENPQIVNLDEVPVPARWLLKKDLYQLGTLRGKKVYTSIMTSRGCPFKCVFCSTSIYGKHIRRRSIDNTISEMRHITDELGIGHLFVLDETMTLDRKYMLALCDAIKKNNIKMTWECGTRANLIDEELIARMVESGLIRISFGLESADLRVRDIIKKEVPLESYEAANKITNKYGVETINSVMLGLPGDTHESIEKTITFVRDSRVIEHATFGIAIPYPGSEMYDMAVRGDHGLKLETQDFSRYQRYGSAVMSVNGISPQELISLQKKGLMRIYFVPWRIIPVIKRFGVRRLMKPFFTSLWSIIREKLSLPSRQKKS
ncbi:MAG TPA: radical SAM protein [Candidatus Omnitrophota bacterium]|nr:radical SAM protein [Candidatus Omnitrophota bacterium]HPD84130.1 radical SAM protein [Candidatus Omnitrophota bacterium]HRZ02987.1 radical SAM protein [Candidatus Omnitrophota bacterium]